MFVLGAAALLLVGYLWRDLYPVLPSRWDYETYRAASLDWLAGRGFYEAYQLAGPYPVVWREVLYPPTALVVLVPFALLPAPLWWGVPLGITAWIVRWHRPSRLRVGLILLCLAWPRSYEAVMNGNPVIFAVAFLALGTRWPVFAPWVALKPPFAPFALPMVRSRAWWLGAGLFGLVSLALLPMWVDYLTVLRNAEWPAAGPLYMLGQAPLVAIPLIARSR